MAKEGAKPGSVFMAFLDSAPVAARPGVRGVLGTAVIAGGLGAVNFAMGETLATTKLMPTKDKILVRLTRSLTGVFRSQMQ